MSLLAVIRHTRAEEEVGRLELLRSGVVGRHAPLAAALLVTIGANVIRAVIVMVGLISRNLPVAGAVALGLAFLGCGFVFAGLGAVTAQISENARPSGGMAASVLGAAYLLRAFGDSSNTETWLSWLSPVGWVQQTRAFAHERWWALGIPRSLVLASSRWPCHWRGDATSGQDFAEIIQRIGGSQSLINDFFAAILPLLATVGTIRSVQAILGL